MKLYRFCLVLFIILFIGNVSALGITPARTTIAFTPGLEQEISFSIVNTENKNMDIVLFAQGELNQSILLKETSFSIKSNEGTRQASYSFKLPQDLSPGTHTTEVVVLQLPEKSQNGQSFVGAAVAVATQLVVNVPYPGKYAQIGINTVNAERGEEATFIIPVISLGDLDLARVSANIDIYNKLNEKVGTFNTAEISVKSGERKDLVAKWKADVEVGEYRAIATVIYDGETVQAETIFNVGSAVLELQQIIVRDFSLGEIAKVEMLVENKWSDKIVGAYTQTQVFNADKKVMAEFKSPTYNMEPLQKADMVSYWDTAGVKAGTYDTVVYLRYNDKSLQQNIELKVDKNSITAIGLGFVISETRGNGSNTTFILISIIVVLILINAAWFLFMRKRLSNNSKRK